MDLRIIGASRGHFHWIISPSEIIYKVEERVMKKQKQYFLCPQNLYLDVLSTVRGVVLN
jgi:hypothetical protein